MTKSRRSLLVALASALAGTVSCSLLSPNEPPGQPTSVGGPSGATPTPARILGVIPLPPAATPTPTPEPVVIRFAHWETGAARDVLQSIASVAEQSSSRIVVDVVTLPFSTHFERLQTSLATGEAPDVFVSSGAYFVRHATDSRLLDLSSRAQADAVTLDQYWTDPVTRPWGGQLLSVPLWTSAEVVYLNLDQLRQVGAPLPPESWTWDDLLALAKRLTIGKPGEIVRWGLLVVNDLVGGWGGFATSNGGTWLDPVARKTTLDSATVEALRWLRDAMLVQHVAPRPIEQQSLTRGGTVDPFLNGAVALFSTGTWELAAALAQAHFQWALARLPRAPRTGLSASPQSVQPGCAFRGTRHPDESWQLLRLLTSDDAQRRWNIGKLRIPSLKSLASEFGTPPPANAGAAVTALSNATDLRFTINWQVFRSAILQALEPAFDGTTELDVAIAAATRAGDAALRAI
jgi:multiple sugar transport system substrate-binding protein